MPRPRTGTTRGGPAPEADEPRAGRPPSSSAPLLHPLAGAAVLFVVGFSALSLEVLWARRLALVFGGTVFAATAVLCAYTLGVAFGAAVIGPLADRHKRPLSLLAGAVTLLGALGLLAHDSLIPLASRANQAASGPEPAAGPLGHATRFGWSLAALALPCLALGGILPTAARCIAPAGIRVGRRVGLIWAASTAGAVLGTLLTGFVLIPRWGIGKTSLAAALPCAGVCIALLLHGGARRSATSQNRRAREPQAPSPSPSQGDPSGTGGSEGSARSGVALPPPGANRSHPRAGVPHSSPQGRETRRRARVGLGVAAMLAGAAMLAAEALYIRALVFFLGGTTYTFTVVVATYLAGLALGSFVSSRWADGRSRQGEGMPSSQASLSPSGRGEGEGRGSSPSPRPLPGRERGWGPWLVLGWLFVLAGLAVAGSLFAIARLDAVIDRLAALTSWTGKMRLTALAAAGVVFVPAVLSGMCMPFFMRLAAGLQPLACLAGPKPVSPRTVNMHFESLPVGTGPAGGGVGRRVGWVSALYNVGAAAGAAAAVLALVPAVGVQRSLAAVAALWLLLGAGALTPSPSQGEGRGEGGGSTKGAPVAPRPALSPKGRSFSRGAARVLCLAGLALCGFLLRDLHLFWPAVERELPGGRRLFYEEGPDALVSVLEQPTGTRSLLINRMVQGDDTDLGRIVQWRQGLIPMLLHPNPKRVCIVGLGTGATAYAASLLTEGTIDVVEMSPGVVETTRHFRGINGNILENPKVNLIVDDGRAFLANTKNTYDVIIIDIVFPNIAGAGNLFSEDFYRICGERLASDGVFVHWVPAWQIQPEDLAPVAVALGGGFSRVAWGREGGFSFWCPVYSSRQPILGLAVLTGGKDVPVGDLERRMRGAPAAELLQRAGLSAPMDLLVYWVGSSSPFPHAPTAGWPGGRHEPWRLLPSKEPPKASAYRVNSDDHPLVEFRVPQRSAVGAARSNLVLLQAALVEPFPETWFLSLATRGWRSSLAERRRAVGLVIAGQLAGAEGNTKAELAAYEQARATGWNDPVVAVFERRARYELTLLQAEEAHAAGQTERAIRLAREAAHLDPNEADAFGLLAEYLVTAGLTGEGLEKAGRAIRLDPASSRWRLARAMARYNLRQYPAALRDAEDALQQDPANPTARQLRQRLLEHLNSGSR